ncbi:hypothetical protein ACFL7D_05070 [candidate division KSB1 bacterium]
MIHKYTNRFIIIMLITTFSTYSLMINCSSTSSLRWVPTDEKLVIPAINKPVKYEYKLFSISEPTYNNPIISFRMRVKTISFFEQKTLFQEQIIKKESSVVYYWKTNKLKFFSTCIAWPVAPLLSYFAWKNVFTGDAELGTILMGSALSVASVYPFVEKDRIYPLRTEYRISDTEIIQEGKFEDYTEDFSYNIKLENGIVVNKLSTSGLLEINCTDDLNLENLELEKLYDLPYSIEIPDLNINEDLTLELTGLFVQYAKINKEDANLRTNPSISDNIIDNCDINEKYNVIASHGDWINVSYLSENAWIHKKNVQLIWGMRK